MPPLLPLERLGIATLIGEAASEGVRGMTCVAEVIRNRMERRYASDGTVEGTVWYPMAFSCWNGNIRWRARLARIDERPANRSRIGDASCKADRPPSIICGCLGSISHFCRFFILAPVCGRDRPALFPAHSRARPMDGKPDDPCRGRVQLRPRSNRPARGSVRDSKACDARGRHGHLRGTPEPAQRGAEDRCLAGAVGIWWR